MSLKKQDRNRRDRDLSNMKLLNHLTHHSKNVPRTGFGFQCIFSLVKFQLLKITIKRFVKGLASYLIRKRCQVYTFRKLGFFKERENDLKVFQLCLTSSPAFRSLLLFNLTFTLLPSATHPKILYHETFEENGKKKKNC